VTDTELVEQIEKKVIEIICEQLNAEPKKISHKTSFINDLGADSLDTVELVMGFEDEFDVRIEDDDAEKIQTVEDAVKFIKKTVLEKLEKEKADKK